MFRISEDLADFLLFSKKNPKVPGLLKDEFKPYVAQNTHTIGFITPVMIQDSDSKFIIELLLPDVESPEEVQELAENPANRSWWLYRRSELKTPDEPLIVQRSMMDKYYSGLDHDVDLTDCAVMVPKPEERTMIPLISTRKELFTQFPDLKDCLDPAKETQYESGRDHNHFH